jgi:hypothetical protein
MHACKLLHAPEFELPRMPLATRLIIMHARLTCTYVRTVLAQFMYKHAAAGLRSAQLK